MELTSFSHKARFPSEIPTDIKKKKKKDFSNEKLNFR